MFTHDYFLQKEAEFKNQRLEKISRHAWKMNVSKNHERRKTLKDFFTFKPTVRTATQQNDQCVGCA
jgi:hypothetical protein